MRAFNIPGKLSDLSFAEICANFFDLVRIGYTQTEIDEAMRSGLK